MPGSSNGFVEEAFTAGADDLLVLEPGPYVSSASAAPRRIRAAEGGRPQGRARLSRRAISGKLICVLGPKGGIGKTMTACNLAVALATRGKRTCWSTSTSSSAMSRCRSGLTPETTIYDLAVSGG